MGIVIEGGKGRSELIRELRTLEMISRVWKVNGGMAKIVYAEKSFGRFDGRKSKSPVFDLDV